MIGSTNFETRTAPRPLALPVVIAALLLAVPTAVPAQAQADAAVRATAAAGAPTPLAARPTVGEQMTYEVRFGSMPVGTGSLGITAVDTVRGRGAWHAVFRVQGGIPFFTVDDRYESWIDTTTGSSLRYEQHIREGTYARDRRYEIFPERSAYAESGKAEQPSVTQPLDEAAFLYALRSLPLEVGRTYQLDRYFMADRNPVVLRVLRKERVTVPAGTFDALVIQPIIKSRGLFSENGRAEVWVSDDSRRTVLQLTSKLTIGSLNLYLKSLDGAK